MPSPTDLRAAALEATGRAHAPYSRFRVGAALEDEQGRVHTGANIECVSFPLGSCAEPTAIGHMVMAGGTRIRQIAVIARNEREGGKIESGITPCGGCRQRIAEFGDADTMVHLCDADGVVRSVPLSQLFPSCFTAELTETA